MTLLHSAVVPAAVIGKLEVSVVAEPVVHTDSECRTGMSLVMVTTCMTMLARSSVVRATTVVTAVNLDHGNRRKARAGTSPSPVGSSHLAGALDRNGSSVSKFELDDGVALAVVSRANVAELSRGSNWKHWRQVRLRWARCCWEVEHSRACTAAVRAGRAVAVGAADVGHCNLGVRAAPVGRCFAAAVRTVVIVLSCVRVRAATMPRVAATAVGAVMVMLRVPGAGAASVLGASATAV